MDICSGTSASLLADLRDVATGKICHVGAGPCPYVGEGIDTEHDRAEPGACPACDVLRRADAVLDRQRPPCNTCGEPASRRGSLGTFCDDCAPAEFEDCMVDLTAGDEPMAKKTGAEW